ncbi:hypothetical protein BSPLISOX_1121 [uncultured Gammaproteobacteria bacterium]|nr:hypothetical protein [uncultured Gammaproteobacteria bacterium]CAC9466902.1 hypothetical protein [uncultured Gammaproteobacteria bacterium]VVH64925.1 hypothetical protein BSPLISOX_1121 [uncultured Gammaproteobacteria bacterium]
MLAISARVYLFCNSQSTRFVLVCWGFIILMAVENTSIVEQ